MHVITSHASLIGDRANNEDSAAIVNGGRAVLLVVADGMGGHEHGERASAAAVEALVTAFSARDGDAGGFLGAAFEQAHRAVLATGDDMPIEARPRTTCVAALVDRRRAWFAHVGDSRAYLLRGGAVVTRTRDHSHVESMIASGEIDESEVDGHPLRNLVERCLGGEPDPVDADVNGPYELATGDIVLLCSDGFWEGIDVAAEAAALCDGADLGAELERLVAAACTACAPHADNTTAAALRVER